MSDNQNLQFTIKAVDEASKNLEQVKSSLKTMGDQVDGTKKQLDDFGNAQGKAKGSTESMATSVFKGQLAFEAFKKGLELAVDFTKESVEAYIEADKKMNLVKATLESTGLSYAKVGGQVEEFASKMARLGVDDEDVALSMAKLTKIAGGDLSKGMQLAKMASDLTASGFGTLESNTDNLAKVMTGKGQRALMEYKIQLDANATTAEQLNAIQQKVTMTTEQYAETTSGKIATVKVAFDNLKESVGEGFVSAIAGAIDDGTQFNDVVDAIDGSAKVLKVTVYEVAEGFIFLGKSVKATYDSMSVTANALVDVFSDWSFEGTSKAIKKVQTDSDGLTSTFNKMSSPLESMAKSAETASKVFEKTHKSGVDMGSGIANANKGAETALVKHADVVKKLGDVYNKLKSDTTTDLANMTSEFLQKMSDMSVSIDKVKKSINDLSRAYNQQATSDTQSVADKIVESENKIADLKSQVLAETDVKRKADLQKQLEDEQKNYDSSKEFAKNNAGAITEAKRRAGLTDLQRTIEDYNTRRALATQEYTEKLADLQNELNAQLNKQAQEFNLYNQKVAKITEIEKAGTDEYIKQSNNRLAQTTDEVNRSIALYQALASAIASVKSASAMGVSTVSVPVAGKRATGGSVSGGSTYLVGERGPEIFTASQNGNIVPNSQLGVGTGNIVINITGTFLSDDAGRKLGDQIISRFKTMSRIGL